MWVICPDETFISIMALGDGDKDGDDDDDLLHKGKEGKKGEESYQRCHFSTDTWTQSRFRLTPRLDVGQLSRKGFN